MIDGQCSDGQPREIALRRLRRAEEFGMSYREYQAVILDRGVYL